MIIQSDPAERKVLLHVAQLMVVAARTAPKARGEDDISTSIVTDDDKAKLADVMDTLGRTRDAQNVRDASIVVLNGVKCGPASDAFWPFKAKLIDLGIAVGSAAKVASDLNVDNRIMYSVGVAAKELGLVDANEIQGIPLSVTGKNIFFDRKS
jgi:uncharacterized ferredoxin-like protein